MSTLVPRRRQFGLTGGFSWAEMEGGTKWNENTLEKPSAAAAAAAAASLSSPDLESKQGRCGSV
jgi:hypothetical protein